MGTPPSRPGNVRVALLLAAAAAFGIVAVLAFRAIDGSGDDRTATPTSTTAPLVPADSSVVAGAGAPTTSIALPDYQVGQCLGLATAGEGSAPVVACETEQAFDLVTAVNSAQSITCAPPDHGGPAAEHTVSSGGRSESWCAVAPPARDGYFTLGTCFQHVESADAATEFVERACDDVLATHRIVGDATEQDCAAVPTATATISKASGEGAGYWCAEVLDSVTG